jgi:hypothetical protein
MEVLLEAVMQQALIVQSQLYSGSPSHAMLGPCQSRFPADFAFPSISGLSLTSNPHTIIQSTVSPSPLVIFLFQQLTPASAPLCHEPPDPWCQILASVWLEIGVSRRPASCTSATHPSQNAAHRITPKFASRLRYASHLHERPLAGFITQSNL